MESGKTITLSKTLNGKYNFTKNKTIDLLIDIKNPEKIYYIDFDIKRI